MALNKKYFRFCTLSRSELNRYICDTDHMISCNQMLFGSSQIILENMIISFFSASVIKGKEGQTKLKTFRIN